MQMSIVTAVVAWPRRSEMTLMLAPAPRAKVARSRGEGLSALSRAGKRDSETDLLGKRPSSGGPVVVQCATSM
jgi:hypothetical protein